MADLSFSQGSDPVCVFNDTSGNQMGVNADGSLSVGVTSQVAISDVTITGDLTANNSNVAVETNGMGQITFGVSGTWSMSVLFEYSQDGITGYAPLTCWDVNGKPVTSAAANGTYIAACTGIQKVRVRAANVVSGDAHVILVAGSGPFVGPLSVNSIPIVELAPSGKAVYSSVISNLTPGATPTDIITIIGSASKDVIVTAIELFTTQTLSGTNTFFIVKRSAADTGGTSTTPTTVPYDSALGNATAVVRQYTANPTSLGASVGNVLAAKITTPAAGSLANDAYVFDFTRGGMLSGYVLNGVAETLALNFNGAALPGGLNITANIIWMEI